MKLEIKTISEKETEYIEIGCHKIDDRVNEIVQFVKQRQFARISKAVIVNLMKISYIKPALNGRFLCRLKNGEQVIISRKYVPDIKEKLKR